MVGDPQKNFDSLRSIKITSWVWERVSKENSAHDPGLFRIFSQVIQNCVWGLIYLIAHKSYVALTFSILQKVISLLFSQDPEPHS